MRTIYIKFRHKDDIYAIQPNYDLVPSGEYKPPKTCGRCGNTLYIPVELPEDATINQPAGDILRPLPKELPHLTIREEPQLPTLAVVRSILHPEIQRLKRFSSMAFVDSNGFEILVNGVSNQPVKHKCEDGS